MAVLVDTSVLGRLANRSDAAHAVAQAAVRRSGSSGHGGAAVTGVVLLGVLLLAIAVVVVLTRRAEAAFRERFPPISDAEFVARCSPGTNPEVAVKVRRIVANYLAVEYERIHPSTSFIEDLGAD